MSRCGFWQQNCKGDSSRYHLEPVALYCHALCGGVCCSGSTSCSYGVGRTLLLHVKVWRTIVWPVSVAPAAHASCTRMCLTLMYPACSHGLHRVTDAVTPVRCRRDCSSRVLGLLIRSFCTQTRSLNAWFYIQ